MNSQNAKNSFNDMKDMMRKAQTPQICTVVSEENWNSLISLTAQQNSIMEQQQEILETLITATEMKDLMNNQTEKLSQALSDLESISTSFLDTMQTTATNFQTRVQSQADNLEDKAKETISEISKQAGRMNENFSNSLSEQKEAMNDIFLRHRIGTWMLTAVQILSLGAFVLWVISQTS